MHVSIARVNSFFLSFWYCTRTTCKYSMTKILNKRKILTINGERMLLNFFAYNSHVGADTSFGPYLATPLLKVLCRVSDLDNCRLSHIHLL